VEVGRVAGQHGDATERISLPPIAVELIARAEVEDTRHDCVDLILLVFVWDQLQAGRHFVTLPAAVASRAANGGYSASPAGGSGRRREPAPGEAVPSSRLFHGGTRLTAG
jgi:hypothetical protein